MPGEKFTFINIILRITILKFFNCLKKKEDIHIETAFSDTMKEAEQVIEFMEWLASAEAEEDEELDLEGWDLYRAAEENRIGVASALINRGDDVNVRDDSNATPLFPAAFSNSLQMAMLLIESGADVNALDNGSWSPLLLASHFGSVEVAMLLVRNGANIEAKDGDGSSSLYYASLRHSLKLVTFLIDNGAKMDAIDLSWMDD